MIRHDREPVSDTCPVINELKVTILKLFEIEPFNDRNLLLFKALKLLEKIRDSNSELRKWGIKEAIAFDSVSQRRNDGS